MHPARRSCPDNVWEFFARVSNGFVGVGGLLALGEVVDLALALADAVSAEDPTTSLLDILSLEIDKMYDCT